MVQQKNGQAATQQEVLLQLLQTMTEAQRASVRALRALADEIQQLPSEFAVPFLPFFRIGDIVRVIRSGGVNDVVIRFTSALPSYRHDFGQISTTSSDQEVTNLELGDDILGQFRFSPVTEFEVEVDNPQGVDQWRTKTRRFRVQPWMTGAVDEAERARHEAMSQFWVWEDDTPRFSLYPLVAATSHQLEAYAEFFGWRYDFVKKDALTGAEKQAVEREVSRGNFRVVRVNGRP